MNKPKYLQEASFEIFAPKNFSRIGRVLPKLMVSHLSMFNDNLFSSSQLLILPTSSIFFLSSLLGYILRYHQQRMNLCYVDIQMPSRLYITEMEKVLVLILEAHLFSKSQSKSHLFRHIAFDLHYNFPGEKGFCL